MPVFDTEELLRSLESDVQQVLASTAAIRDLDRIKLNAQPAAGKWSIAQILEHLNSYNRYYLPEIEKAISKGKAKNIGFVARFKAGWFGNYFTNMMLPKADGKIANRMNAPKDHTPLPNLDAEKVINEFVNGQRQLTHLLQASATTDVGKLRVPISISRFIQLKLGDTFRFLIAHQQRHFVQLTNALETVNRSSANAMA